MVSTLFSWHCFWSAKGIFFEKTSSMQCHSQAFLWDVYFGRHFISQHPHDDKQKLTREGIGKLYPLPKTIQLKLEISRITLKNAWLPLLWQRSSYRTHDLFCSGWKNYLGPSLGKQWRAVGFDYFSFELVLTLNLQERSFWSTGIF